VPVPLDDLAFVTAMIENTHLHPGAHPRVLGPGPGRRDVGRNS